MQGDAGANFQWSLDKEIEVHPGHVTSYKAVQKHSRTKKRAHTHSLYKDQLTNGHVFGKKLEERSQNLTLSSYKATVLFKCFI